MIEITRNHETKVTVKLSGGPLDATFSFTYDCGSAHYAELLRQHFQSRLWAEIEAVRKEEYEKGYKDGRAKRGKVAWFFSSLKRNVYP